MTRVPLKKVKALASAGYCDPAELEGASEPKYLNQKVEYDGYTFDSKAEYEDYVWLRARERAGAIKRLQVHPVFEIHPAFTDWSGHKWPRLLYESDFSFVEQREGEWVSIVWERKGYETQGWKLKRRLFAFTYPSTVLEVHVAKKSQT